jgi:hypothetical protein
VIPGFLRLNLLEEGWTAYPRHPIPPHPHSLPGILKINMENPENTAGKQLPLEKRRNEPGSKFVVWGRKTDHRPASQVLAVLWPLVIG